MRIWIWIPDRCHQRYTSNIMRGGFIVYMNEYNYSHVTNSQFSTTIYKNLSSTTQTLRNDIKSINIVYGLKHQNKFK